MSELPMYISQRGHGEQVVQPPGDVQGAKCFAFTLTADPAKLDAFVKKNLTAPTNGEMEYRVVGSHVFLTFLDAQRLTSTSEVVGYVPDRECAVWVLLAAKERGWLKPERLVFWMPYVFVDTSIAMATGREIWGFPKEMGNILVPTDPKDPARFVAEATVFKTLEPNTRGTVGPLIEIVRDGPFGLLPEIWKNGKEAFEAIIGQLTGQQKTLPIYNWASDASLVVDLFELLFSHQVPLVNLKQFRDAEQPTRACYQSLVENACVVEKLYRGGLLIEDFKVNITPCASHSIASDLGLPSGPISVDFAFWVEMDFLVSNGKEVWRART